jgi:DNA modification methylase
MRFMIEQAYRVIKPGCNLCVHIQQLLSWKNQHGYIGKRDFNGAVRDMFMCGGFEFKGEAVIPKNPQVIAQRLNLHSLMFATGKRNARDLAPAQNDYVLIFQKPGECESKVRALYDLNDNPGGWVTTNEWIAWASGIWSDIRETDVLDGHRNARDVDDEKHVCPLQLEVIRRCVKLYTNPGEVVLDMFMGIGSTAVVSLQEGRNAVGFELKESYHQQALKNVAKFFTEREAKPDQMSMFAAELVEAA